MSRSSDALIKRELSSKVGQVRNDLTLRIFPGSSNFDQKLFGEGGLTFAVGDVSYGSCDAAWTIEEEWKDPNDGKRYRVRPLVALEGTDALNTGSTGNAQYQRFHHVLGAVRSGIPGVYYLKKGPKPIRPELHGMAAAASAGGVPYLVTDDLAVVKNLVAISDDFNALVEFAIPYIEGSKQIFGSYIAKNFGSMEQFAFDRSTVLKQDYLIKHAGRMVRNFTDSSQRAGHIAVGEMFLTKLLFADSFMYYLFPRMTSTQIALLDERKADDKEWRILRSEEGVKIIGRDQLNGLDTSISAGLKALESTPLKGESMQKYNKLVKKIESGLRSGALTVSAASR